MELIGMILMLIGGVNLVWFLLWALISWSGTLGAKISKKVGTDNEGTDDAINAGKSLGKEALTKVGISAALIIAGAVLYYLVG